MEYTIDTMIKQLENLKAEHGGDAHVMFREPYGAEVFAVRDMEYRVAEEMEFPEDWDMPEGFEFVLMQV